MFYILGTTITFIFIIIMLQIAHLVVYADPPFVNTQRTIHLGALTNNKEDDLGIELQDISAFVKAIPDAESYSISNYESVNADINGKIRPLNANFTNAAYFENNEFYFIAGQPFKGDSDAAQQAVITKDIARKYYQNDALGKKITLQDIDYNVVGVVDNYSSLLNPHESANVWLPYKYNKFVPSANRFYTIDILFSKDVPVQEMKKNLRHALTQYFSARGEEVNLDGKLYTIQEEKEELMGGGKFAYGISIIIFLLLAIPAINIMTLSMANVYSRAQEIAIRRALGADKFSSFMQIVTENLLLVFAGLIFALLLIYPMFVGVERIFFAATNSASALTSSSLSWIVLLFAILLAVLFTMLSGGIPACNIANKNIANVLKGEAQ